MPFLTLLAAQTLVNPYQNILVSNGKGTNNTTTWMNLQENMLNDQKPIPKSLENCLILLVLTKLLKWSAESVCQGQRRDHSLVKQLESLKCER
jgi:hypothetical protein